jgi:hypothetical protein
LALLVASPLAEADWLQNGYDAARTGHVPFGLPENDDIALVLELPQERNATEAPAGPVIAGGLAFVAVDQEVGSAGLRYRRSDANGVVYRVDLEKANATEFAHVRGSILQMASDGKSLFVLTDVGVLHRLPLDGSRGWAVAVKLGPGEVDPSNSPSQMSCAPLAAHAPRILVACKEDLGYGPLWVRAVDAASGRLDWTWTLQTSWDGRVPQDVDPASAVDYAMTEASPAPADYPILVGMTVLADFVLVTTYHADGVSTPATAYTDVWALSLAAGSQQWHRGFGPLVFGVDQAAERGESHFVIPSVVTGNKSAFFLEGRKVSRFPLPTPGYSPQREKDLRQGSRVEGDVGSGFAFDGEHLFATSLKTIYRLTPDLIIVEGRPLEEPGQFWGRGGLIRADNCLLARAFSGVPDALSKEPASASSTLYCLDPASLQTRWQKEFFRHVDYVATDGLVVVKEGLRLVVVGTTTASLVPRFAVTTQYPEVGASVAIDLAESQPGLQGAPDEFAVDWGDGTPIRWQSTPVFTHQYPLASEFSARALVRNRAGQTASLTIPFFVGQDNPQASYLELAFAPRNQERTFFVLGAFLTLLFAALGFVRLRIRHSRFQQELREIDEAYARHRADPDVCVAVLEERRHHVRGLLVRRRLDDSQVGTLERRIDELHRMVRMQLVDERFEFLPLGIVKRLQAVLQDGMVTKLEESQILDVVERESTMLPEQKQRVRELLARWSSQDGRRAEARVGQARFAVADLPRRKKLDATD